MLLWWLAGSSRLSREAHLAITKADSVHVSAATACELGIKVAIGKLKFDADLDEQIARNHFRPLPVTIQHALAASRLPRHHNDVFDRMLVAQAVLESLTLLTSDAQLKHYDAKVMLA